MRRVFILSAALMIGGLVAGAAASKASAGPMPAAGAAKFPPGLVQKVDYWRRYWRHHGYGPDVVPDADPAAPPVAVEALPPPPPPRPASCGQYHYWDGERCVDARYNNPYLGRK